MREDLFKKMTEPSRRKGIRRKGKTPRDWDSYSRIGKMKPLNTYGERKDQNLNFRILKRFLDTQLGRPWNNVYSEIIKDSKWNPNIRHDLAFWARNQVYMPGKYRTENGRIVNARGWELRNQFYVDDKGFLCKSPPWSKKSYVKTEDEQLQIDLNNILSGSNTRTIVHEGSLWKGFVNKKTNMIDVFHRMNNHYIRTDAKLACRYNLNTVGHFLWKWMDPKNKQTIAYMQGLQYEYGIALKKAEQDRIERDKYWAKQNAEYDEKIRKKKEYEEEFKRLVEAEKLEKSQRGQEQTAA